MKSILFITEKPKRYSTIINDIIESNNNLEVISDLDNSILSNIDFESYSLIIIDYNDKIGKFLDYVSYYKLNNNYTKYLILVNVIRKIKNIEKYEMILKEEMILKYKKLLDKMYILDIDESLKKDSSKKNIVLIDDDIISLEILNGILESNEFNITLFNEAVSAFNKIKEMISQNEKIDLILVDLNMPVLSGYSFIELLRGDELTRYLPIMVVSSNSLKASVNEVAKYNIEAYIVKPFNKDELLSRINSFLNLNN